MVAGDWTVREGRPQRRSAVAAAMAPGALCPAAVLLLVVVGQKHGGVMAAPPAIQNAVESQQRANALPHSVVSRGECTVSLQLGERSNGGQHLTVSAPPHCHCTELELAVLQRRGIPCRPDAAYRCSWMAAHTAVTNTSSASFLVSVGGKFRPVARCKRPPQAGDDRRLRYADRLFVGRPVTLPGIDLPSWNVSLAASTYGNDLVVRVVRQMDAADTDAYFPELYVTLFRLPRQQEYGPRRVAYRRVAFSPAENGTRAEFTGAATLNLHDYKVDARPAGSWVCQGANDGCQKRYAMLGDLLKLTEERKGNRETNLINELNHAER